MRLAAVPAREVARRLRRHELGLRIGPIVAALGSDIAPVGAALRTLYADFEVELDPPFADFRVAVARSRGLRRIARPQARFRFDEHEPFKPLPLPQAYAMFEWGLNWCMATGAHQFLVVHAAAVERGGRAFIFPGRPGSGKSTLCAALVNRGWRLLSDEMALLSREDGRLHPFPRPVNLKNQSIEVIRDFAPGARFGPLVRDTHKGTICHMKPPLASIERQMDTAPPALIIFPRFERGASAGLTPRPKGRAFMETAENGFNYDLLGREGFDLLADAVDSAACFDLAYGDLEVAIGLLEGL